MNKEWITMLRRIFNINCCPYFYSLGYRIWNCFKHLFYIFRLVYFKFSNAIFPHILLGMIMTFSFRILLINMFLALKRFVKSTDHCKIYCIQLRNLLSDRQLLVKIPPLHYKLFCCHWLSDQITSVSEFLFLSSNISPFMDWPNNVIIEISLIMGTININILQTKLTIEKYCEAFILEHLT